MVHSRCQGCAHLNGDACEVYLCCEIRSHLRAQGIAVPPVKATVAAREDQSTVTRPPVRGV